MAVDKKLLKRLRALYVEDDDNIRNELAGLLGNFFETVYTAVDGDDGLKVYQENQENIDVILSDINMPGMNGIEMMKEIRKLSPKIPVIFATAYSDTNYLSDAIKLRVYDYIVKPIDIRNLLSVMNDLAYILYQNFLIEQQTKELEKYKDVIDTNNIVIKTDKLGKIQYVNQHFCDTTGYDSDDLVGESIQKLNHKDVLDSVFDKIYLNIKTNEPWQGRLKCVTKFKDDYTVECYVISTITDAGEISGAFWVQRDITVELNQKRDIQKALMKDKGEIFLKGKESMAELNVIINELNSRVVDLQKLAKKAHIEKENILINAEKFSVENKRLTTDVAGYRKNAEYLEDKSTKTLKLNKELVDLKHQVKTLKARNDKQSQMTEKDFMQEKVNYEVKIDDLEKDLEICSKKLDDIGDADAFAQKLEYWKDKAKDEAKRVEQLEKEIIRLGDKGIMKRIFR
ncbi:MAG: response regulator [Campylobacterota bacterium]|nr:response regulator [Campylobacterota bacterium]